MAAPLPSRRALLALAGGLALAACQPADGGPVASVTGNPRVVLDSLDGAPDGLAPRFSAALAGEAQRRGMTLLPASARGGRYRLKGYLTAGPSAAGGAELAWVWDLYDGDRRAQRLAGAEPLAAGAAGDPWAGVDDAALARAAAKGMNEIAQFLGGA